MRVFPAIRLFAMFAVTVGLNGCVGVSLDPEERPVSKAVDDFNTRTELSARLLAEDAEMFTNVSTSVIEGRVHLSGNVLDEELRLKATELAWETPNVTEVVNDIEVTDRTGLVDVARDRWISAKVRARILADSSIRDVNYTIDTQNRVVFILGIAQNRSELDKVIAHARAVNNVERVVNYAVLKDDPRRFAEPSGSYVHPREPVTPPATP